MKTSKGLFVTLLGGLIIFTGSFNAFGQEIYEVDINLRIKKRTFEEMFKDLNTYEINGNKGEPLLSQKEIVRTINQIFEILKKEIETISKQYSAQTEIKLSDGTMTFSLLFASGGAKGSTKIEKLILHKCKFSDYEVSGEFQKLNLKIMEDMYISTGFKAKIAIRTNTYEALVFGNMTDSPSPLSAFKFKQGGKIYYCDDSTGGNCTSPDSANVKWKVEN